jgi:hypothetical protein
MHKIYVDFGRMKLYNVLDYFAPCILSGKAEYYVHLGQVY